ncbi:TonB-linked outer membrane protein, SusC/RagA family [Flavobacterium sp. TAB 87]|nr:TonB-linked outer membrane protein, SusC/RagA family [Flavobacterium sp. TAB 87]
MGFKTAYIPVDHRKSIAIVLQYDTTTLKEVRVNAGYYSVKESERTGNIARITAQDIENQPVTNVLATMQGRMAGVSVTQTTGVPGGGFEIKIRGQNSLRPDANAPLYIIDGVPYESDPIGYSQTSSTYPTTTSPLNSINPDNIESIEILKDADATAIYGSRGANGVVLISTKKGKVGKTTFTLKASTAAGTVTKFIDMMNTQQYLTMREQAFLNDQTSYKSKDYDINGKWDQSRYTNWQKELIGGTAQINDFAGTVSGGSENTQFLLSGNYHTESTVFVGDFLYKKGGSQFNLNHHSEDSKFRLTFSAGYTLQNNDLPAFDFTNDSRNLAPNAPELYNADGSLNWADKTWNNPLRYLNAKFEAQTNDLIANTMFSYEIGKGLWLKSSFGYTNLKTIETRISPSTIYNPANNITSARSSLYLNNTDRSSWIAEPQINWEKEVFEGNLDILLGATFQNQNTKRLYQSGDGFSSNSLIYDLAAASYVTVLLNDETQYKYQAFFGRVNYNWKQKYIANFTARRDGSSRFGPGNQFANFGAIGAAWLFSNENFLKNNSWLSFGKIRSSYGTTGNDKIGDYQFLDTYTLSGVNYNGVVGLEPSRLYNQNFGWETNKKLEIALELGFLNDRIFTTFAWYQNRSSNQLTGIPLPGTTGFSSLQANLNAVVENKGVELTLRTVNFTTANFKWTSNFNLTFARNTLLSFPGLENSTYSQKYRIAQPLNIKLFYEYLSVDPQTRIYQFADVNGDGKITSPEDQQAVSDLNPKYYGGFQNQLTYKQWRLDFLFQFVKQKNLSYLNSLPGIMVNQPVALIDSWGQVGENANYQLYSSGVNSAASTAYSRYTRSSAAVEDASFIRLKNIALSYDVPLNLKGTQCRIMLQGQNLLTFTKYQGGDPEFTTQGFLPPLKVLSAAVQLTF